MVPQDNERFVGVSPSRTGSKRVIIIISIAILLLIVGIVFYLSSRNFLRQSDHQTVSNTQRAATNVGGFKSASASASATPFTAQNLIANNVPSLVTLNVLGQVTKIQSNTITMKTETGVPLSFSVDTTVKILPPPTVGTADNKATPTPSPTAMGLSDIQVNDTIQVILSSTANKPLRATQILIMKKATASPTPLHS